MGGIRKIVEKRMRSREGRRIVSWVRERRINEMCEKVVEKIGEKMGEKRWRRRESAIYRLRFPVQTAENDVKTPESKT